MNLQEIVDAARNRFNNYEKPYLHHDDEMVEYANTALDIISRDSGLIKRYFHKTYCMSYTVAGTSRIAIPAQLIDIHTVLLVKEETLLLDVAPSTSWAVGDTITGVSSAKTCSVVEVVSSTEYVVEHRTGEFTLGEVLTNGTYTADQGATYPVFWDHTTNELKKTSILEMKKISDWMYHKDEPTKYLTDVTHGDAGTNSYLYLYPTPDDYYVIRMAGHVYISTAMSTTSMSSQTPDMDARFHPVIVDGIVYQMYLKRGDKTYDPKSADIYFKKFRTGIHDIKKYVIKLEGQDLVLAPHNAFI